MASQQATKDARALQRLKRSELKNAIKADLASAKSALKGQRHDVIGPVYRTGPQLARAGAALSSARENRRQHVEATGKDVNAMLQWRQTRLEAKFGKVK